ncbi:stAR-related lipid transfer protein 8 isoform X1 [Prionailurus iriomotensis]
MSDIPDLSQHINLALTRAWPAEYSETAEICTSGHRNRTRGM